MICFDNLDIPAAELMTDASFLIPSGLSARGEVVLVILLFFVGGKKSRQKVIKDREFYFVLWFRWSRASW